MHPALLEKPDESPAIAHCRRVGGREPLTRELLEGSTDVVRAQVHAKERPRSRSQKLRDYLE